MGPTERHETEEPRNVADPSAMRADLGDGMPAARRARARRAGGTSRDDATRALLARRV